MPSDQLRPEEPEPPEVPPDEPEVGPAEPAPLAPVVGEPPLMLPEDELAEPLPVPVPDPPEPELPEDEPPEPEPPPSEPQAAVRANVDVIASAATALRRRDDAALGRERMGPSLSVGG